MRSNREYLDMAKKIESIQKMIALPNITFSAEEADRFIEGVWDESVMSKNARLVKMASATKNVRHIGIGTADILKPAATFGSSDYKDTFDENNVQLSSNHFRAALVIHDEDLEDLTVGSPAQLKSTIMSMAQKKIASELDLAYWIADTQNLSGFASTDIKSTFDGWRYQLDNSQSGETYENDVTGSCVLMDASNVITGKAGSFDLATTQGIVEQDSNAPYNQEYKFAKMLQYYPSEYKMGGLSKLRFFVNDQIALNYIEALSDRATALGDAIITGKQQLSYGTVPIVQCPLMPTVMEIYAAGQKENYDATNGDLTDCLLTHENNLIVGIQRKITMESERSAADEANYFFFSLRVDVAIEDVYACLLTKRLKVV